MAKCRIQSIKPPCSYVLEGVTEVLLLDFDDFKGFQFDGDDLYNNCLVAAILRTDEFKEVEAPDLVAKYSSTLSNGVYAHTLETFIGELSADTLANLHLATKRRQVPVFKAANGRYYTYGYEAGAAVSYTNQTAEAIGSLVTITATSTYPLFEVLAAAISGAMVIPEVWNVDYDNNTYCENG
jgi:hypothetical protein